MDTSTTPTEAPETPEAKEEIKPKVYVFIQEKGASHPIQVGLKCLKGRILDESGRELAELYAQTVAQLQQQAIDSAIPPGHKMVWVATPHEHPELRALLEAELMAEGEEPPEPAGPRAAERTQLDIVRDEHNLCAVCEIKDVCQIPNLPMYTSKKVTVTGCLAFKPETLPDES